MKFQTLFHVCVFFLCRFLFFEFFCHFLSFVFFFFFFNDTATTEIYTLSLHDALPISIALGPARLGKRAAMPAWRRRFFARSEEHTSELQSQSNLVCRLLLEKKKKKQRHIPPHPKSTNKYQ